MQGESVIVLTRIIHAELKSLSMCGLGAGTGTSFPLPLFHPGGRSHILADSQGEGDCRERRVSTPIVQVGNPSDSRQECRVRCKTTALVFVSDARTTATLDKPEILRAPSVPSVAPWCIRGNSVACVGPGRSRNPAYHLHPSPFTLHPSPRDQRPTPPCASTSHSRLLPTSAQHAWAPFTPHPSPRDPRPESRVPIGPTTAHRCNTRRSEGGGFRATNA